MYFLMKSNIYKKMSNINVEKEQNNGYNYIRS